MSRKLVILVVMMAAGCGNSPPKCTTPDARGVVAATQPREQFKSILTASTQRTQTMAMASKRDGSQADTNLLQAVDAAVDRYGVSWERNLVDSWSILSPTELQQACDALTKRDRETFMKLADRVGPGSKSRNEPLLRRAGAEVLKSVWER